MQHAHFGIHFDVVARSRGMTAARRAAYQAGGRARGPDGKIYNYRVRPEERRGHWLLLPRDAPRWTSDEVWAQAAKMERQWNAQEGRILDIQLPRGLLAECRVALRTDP